jgi:hypothetical protein
MSGSTTWYATPHPITEWSVAGQVVPGHEANGLALPWRVLDSPERYVVIGRTDYADGRWYLEFAAVAGPFKDVVPVLRPWWIN